ncbi:hypothetical protein [uncultured Thiohalocapsa sp.]|uniref:hypothetical protein n=1 Tax=uncultured Thiohalocapsa sp. TaxID=768990 RepID=UPI0025D3A329|nr:hypothetical protein [uncultured Thiohalocapsa sp.]
MKTIRALPTLTIVGLSAVLLFGCGEDGDDMGTEEVREEAGEAMEETREAARSAAEEVGETADEAVDQTREAVEETGDRIESATD